MSARWLSLARAHARTWSQKPSARAIGEAVLPVFRRAMDVKPAPSIAEFDGELPRALAEEGMGGGETEKCRRSRRTL